MSAAQSFHLLGAMALTFFVMAAGLFVLGGIGRLISRAYRALFPKKQTP